MKKIVNICFMWLSLLAIISCEGDEIEADFSDIEVYVPNWAGTDDQLIGAQINVNDWLVFMDLSQGAISHEWSTSDSTGIKFLQQNLPAIEPNENYLAFIDEEKGTTSNDFIAPVIYTKPGLQGLRLYNTYRDSVGFSILGNVNRAEFDADLNLWVIDTTFFVDVYDSITPDYLVRDFAGFEIPLNLTDTVEITLRVGDFLTFVDKSTLGRPNDRTWTIPGATLADPSADSIQAIYTQVTGEDQFFVPRLLSRRSGDSVPRNSKSAIIPLRVKVLPPEANVEFLNLAVNEVGNIVLEFNQGIIIPSTSDLTIQYDGVNENIRSISHFSNQNKAAIILEMEKIPQFGTEVTLAIPALTITSEFSTPEDPKSNDNPIAGSVTSEFGLLYTEDFNSGVDVVILGGSVGGDGLIPTDSVRWTVQEPSTFTFSSDAFEGALAGEYIGSTEPNADYLRTPLLNLEPETTYILQCQLEVLNAAQIGEVVRIFLFNGGTGVVGDNSAGLTEDYQQFSLEFTTPEVDNGYFFRIGPAVFNEANRQSLQFRMDDLVIFEKVD